MLKFTNMLPISNKRTIFELSIINYSHLKLNIMTTTTNISVYGLQSSRNFENKIESLINDYLTHYDLKAANEIYISDAGMNLKSGYGQYSSYVTIEIDGRKFNLSVHTNDSEKYDYFNNVENYNRTYSNAIKSLVESVIEYKLDLIENTISQEEE